jgi:NCAIR mutase (PurE)-related protein
VADDDQSIRFDWQRRARTGIPEVVFGQGKSLSQLVAIIEQSVVRNESLFITRLTEEKAEDLVEQFGEAVTYHELARCMRVGSKRHIVHALPDENLESARVGIVSAGTSDLPLVAEIQQTLEYLGADSDCYNDVGVAGLWRLTELRDQLARYPVLIAVAGMEGALFSVLAGLVQAPVIAVPSAVGYGVSEGGHAALGSALSSCAPGLAVVNIDNGFGAAALAVKMLGIRRIEPA